MTTVKSNNENMTFIDTKPEGSNLYYDVLTGLKAPQKNISSKYLYDHQGSELFELITKLEEYYPTRTEISILENFKDDIVNFIGEDVNLIEFGSGSSEKMKILLDTHSSIHRYIPIDISRDFLYESTMKLAQEYPLLNITAICGDYTSSLALPDLPTQKKVVFFPGSTIGNFESEALKQFFLKVHELLSNGDGLLVGVDVKKDIPLLEAAYNDSQGITARFNLNLLTRINRELLSDIDVSYFIHRAIYNERYGRIEMHLQSEKSFDVTIGNEKIHFEKGETIHTENSYKYTIEEFKELAENFGFISQQVWTDDEEKFSIHYLEIRK